MAIEILKLRVATRARSTIDLAIAEQHRLGHEQLLPDHIFLASLKSRLARKLFSEDRLERLADEVERWIEPPKRRGPVHQDTEDFIQLAQEIANKRPSRLENRLPGDRELLAASLLINTLVPGLMFANPENINPIRQRLFPENRAA